LENNYLLTIIFVIFLPGIATDSSDVWNAFYDLIGFAHFLIRITGNSQYSPINHFFN